MFGVGDGSTFLVGEWSEYVGFLALAVAEDTTCDGLLAIMGALDNGQGLDVL